MPVYAPAKRGTLLLPSGTYHNPDLKHLFIICTDKSDRGDHLLVSVSRWRNDLCDSTCMLEPGCHEFIRYKSYILYRKARIERTQTLIDGVAAGAFVPKAPLDDAVFERVCDGILASPHTPYKAKRYYRRQADE